MDPEDGAEMPIGVKQKRPNCTQKIEDRKTVQEVMVKCALNGLLRGDRPCKESVRQAVQNQVTICSKRLQLACASSKLLLRETFRDIDTSESGNAYVPQLFDQTFHRHLMLGVNETRKLFEESVSVHFKRPKKTRAKFLGTSSLVRLEPNDVGVQIDPGGSNILYCVWHDGCDHLSMVLKRRGYCVDRETTGPTERLSLGNCKRTSRRLCRRNPKPRARVSISLRSFGTCK